MGLKELFVGFATWFMLLLTVVYLPAESLVQASFPFTYQQLSLAVESNCHSWLLFCLYFFLFCVEEVVLLRVHIIISCFVNATIDEALG